MRRSTYGAPIRRAILILCVIIGMYWLYSVYWQSEILQTSPPTLAPVIDSTASGINIVDLHQVTEDNITCVKTKELFTLYRTTICIHLHSDIVSASVASDGIWEEEYVTLLLRILIRNPFLDVIDIGANIGSYAMFVAGALGRFTIAVECYLPNIERIRRAVQLQQVQQRVVLVHNALYSKSGEYLTLADGGPSGMQLGGSSKEKVTSQLVVQTARLDDLLPILVERKVQSVLIKIDIEGSEVYMCESGSRLFDQIDVQLVMMEWGHGFRKQYRQRYQSIADFFTQRNYVPTDPHCTELSVSKWESEWPGNIYWIKRINYKKNIC